MRRPTPHLLLNLILLLLSVCSFFVQARAQEESHNAGDAENRRLEFLLVNGLSNSDFEWVADTTTRPAKYGAYWLNAFSYREGDSTDLIVEDRPYSGRRLLRLSPANGKVTQKIACDTRWTDRIRILLALRLTGDASLDVSLEDGPGHEVIVRFRSAMDSGASPNSVIAAWLNAPGPHDGDIVVRPVAEPGKESWSLALIDAGAMFGRCHGTRPVPRLDLHLECGGSPDAFADVDHVIVEVPAPRFDSMTLKRDIVQKVLWSLETWYLPKEQGGLGLVDAGTGYVRYVRYDVETGKDLVPGTHAGLHTIQDLLLRWVAYVKERSVEDPEGWKKERDTWTPYLETYTRCLLEHNFDLETDLPCAVTLDEVEPVLDEPVTVAAYMDFLMKARDAVSALDLKDECLEQARRTADRLLTLRRVHDLPKRRRNDLTYDTKTRRFEGEWPNWYGLLPEKLTPRGVIEPPRRFNTSWAILSGKPFWYHYFKSIASIMAVHEFAPDKRDIKAVIDIVSYYHRDWDAARYDLENDTDDHYGYFCKDLLRVVKHGGDMMKPIVERLQSATDHRLERDAGGAAGTLWIQGIRLGTACAGDSPRAFEGVVGLYELPPRLNPVSSGLPLYREAIMELAANDFKGRQLTNGQFTQSFFKNWEMVCICFRGRYQGDCREKPASYWHGDVGDTFGGPPTTAIYAQSAAYRVASRGERSLILSRLATILHITDSTMRRRYGYLYGLDETVAKQYELPDKYVMGVSRNSPAFLGYIMALIKLLPFLDASNDPDTTGIELLSKVRMEDTESLKVELRIRGPAHGRVLLPCYAGSLSPFPAVVSDNDPRIVAFDLDEGWRNEAPVELDEKGGAGIERIVPLERHIVFQPILIDETDPVPQSIGPPLVIEP